MSQKPSSSVLAFAAAGALGIAALWAPAANAAPVDQFYGWLTAGAFGLGGVVMAIQAYQVGDARPSPWPGIGPRILWALRPRAWMIAWAAVLIGVAIAGTPHLAVQYPPRTPSGFCDYAGVSGIKRVSTPDCPWIVWR
jgi:hypothetical protein